MILKNKNNDIALRSFSEILDDILQTPEGNIGLILSSSYSINTQVKLMNINRNFTLLDAFRRIPDSVIKLFLLPPPTLFFGNYRKAHAKYALELMKARVFVQFDRLVHSKFLLFWSINNRLHIKHRIYYGSTNFTNGGLVRNIEEFYRNRRSSRYSAYLLRPHVFYLNMAYKLINRIINLYDTPDYWVKNLDNLQSNIITILNYLKQKALVAKDLIKKLELSTHSYSYILDVFSELWNLPGKQFAYNECEKLLLKVDDYAGFNLEFLEELMMWPDETLMEFIKVWKIDVEGYLEIPDKVIESLLTLRKDLEEYKNKGYEAYIFHEEKELIEQIKSKQIKEALSILRSLLRFAGK